jgi:hypothetical protein
MLTLVEGEGKNNKFDLSANGMNKFLGFFIPPQNHNSRHQRCYR